MKIKLKPVLYGALAVIAIYPFFYFITVYYQSYSILRDLKPYAPCLATRLYDANGELISELYDESRSFIPIEKVPEHVKNAFIATEDRTFYQHIGYDIRSILRALVVDFFTGELRQGGSTITQQLVKRTYTKGERAVRRKIVELLIAQEYEKRYTKPQILEMYLNLIYFGHGAYGIDSASRFYFNCPADRMNIVQAAILASMTTAPNRFSPIRDPETAFTRSRIIIEKMVDAGFITGEQGLRQFDEFWRGYLDELRTRYPTLGVRDRKKDRAPHFTEFIRRGLVDEYGAEKVYRGGMEVHTTLDLRCQEIAEKIMREGLVKQNEITSRYNRRIFQNFDRVTAEQYLAREKLPKSELVKTSEFYSLLRGDLAESVDLMATLFSVSDVESTLSGYLESCNWFQSSGRAEGALVALNPHSGAIMALIGGSSFSESNQLNRAVQAKRQPGSAFKIFIYGAGIASRLLTAATSFFDISTDTMEPEREWRPRNYDRESRGLVRARRAIAISLNTIAVKIYERIGGRRIVAFASRMMGIPQSRFKVDPTLALGTTEVTPLEITRGAAVYANGGLDVVPYGIHHINDRNGKKIFDISSAKERGGTRILSRGAAYIMTSLMREVISSGTAYVPVRRVAGLRIPAAGKTGTNTAFRDAWFVGFTPNLAATVWIGCDVPRFSLGTGQSGAVAAAPLWGNFMEEVHRFLPAGKFPERPDEVTVRRVCSVTGNIPVGGCPMIDELFIAGTEPHEKCGGNHQHDDSI